MSLKSLSMKGMVKAFLKEHPDYTKERLERMYDSCPPVHSVRAGDGVVVIESRMKAILAAEDVAWVYTETRSVEALGLIPVFWLSMVWVYTKSGKRVAVSVLRKQKARELMNYLSQKLKGVAYGYTDELMAAWKLGKKDGYQAFWQLAAREKRII